MFTWRSGVATGNKGGAPSMFTDELALQVCTHIAQGKSLRSIAAIEGMPCTMTVLRWVRDKPEFSLQYAHAREARAEAMAEEILEIADESIHDQFVDDQGNLKTNSEAIARSKLRVDSRKWLASKWATKKYGDKVAVGGAEDLPPIQTNDLDAAARIAALLTTATNRKAGGGED